MRYEFQAVTTEDARWHWQRETDRAGNRILHFRDGDTYPCRHCLKEAGREAGALLFSYQTALPHGIYAQPTAIFLCKDECARHPSGPTVPEIVANRYVALRAFRADGLMDYAMNTLTDGSQAATEATRILANPDIAHINVHTALAGCFLCAIRRT